MPLTASDFEELTALLGEGGLLTSEAARFTYEADALTLEQDGKFSGEVDTKGHKETLTGQAGFKDETLALFQTEGPPLAGKVTQGEPNKFVFSPSGAGDKSPGLTFTR